VASHDHDPLAVLPAVEDEPADRPLAALVVAVEQVDGHALPRVDRRAGSGELGCRGIPERALPEAKVGCGDVQVAGQPAEARRLLTAYEASVPEGIRRGESDWYTATGWLALAEGRPKDAVAAFVRGRSAPSCWDCTAWEEGVAYERANQPDSAIASYERAVGPGTGFRQVANAWGLAPSLKRLGELSEERGDKARALDYYTRFVTLWKDADPVLQPTVREVRGRMAKLAGESVKSQ